jgi:ribose 1,5-bisphosphate isomerase
MDSIIETANKISDMEIRGASRIARAAAEALRDLAFHSKASSIDEFNSEIERGAEILLHTRPTAVSLSNAIRMISNCSATDVAIAQELLIANANRFIDDSIKAMEQIGMIGSRRIQDGDTILTHCNSLAALSVIEKAHLAKKEIKVIATESRPRLQGRLTIKMLDELGVTTEFIVDSAVRSVMNEVDLVVVGADVIALDGSVINKIGTSQIALCAHEAETCFMVAAEIYKFSPNAIDGGQVKIEMRSEEEVLPDLSQYEHVHVRNPAFDVTPPQYIDIICTEAGAMPPEMCHKVLKDKMEWIFGNRDL